MLPQLCFFLVCAALSFDFSSSSDCPAACQAIMKNYAKDVLVSTFVRYGRDQCTVDSKLIYKGRAFGKSVGDEGSGTNQLCLPYDIDKSDKEVNDTYGRLYPAQYGDNVGIGNSNEKGVPCALCLATYPVTILYPAKEKCPDDFQKQYSGFLSSQTYQQRASQYVCLDENANAIATPSQAGDRHEFSYVVFGSTGSKAVRCVVCSKKLKIV